MLVRARFDNHDGRFPVARLDREQSSDGGSFIPGPAAPQVDVDDYYAQHEQEQRGPEYCDRHGFPHSSRPG
jgi:hypothetical protein